MKILITGGRGFIGRHVVALLLERGHSVTILTRGPVVVGNETFALGTVHYLEYNIEVPNVITSQIAGYDVLLHLAWPDLDHYRSLGHISESLGIHCRFLEAMVRAGIPQLLVAGTCFEYGLQDGCLSEDLPTNPVQPYSIAKDTLRRFLQALQKEHHFCLQWARLFYMYGKGQPTRSLIGQLDLAIDSGNLQFPMSGGEQLRDYLPVTTIADRLVSILEARSFDGVVNICSGIPISVRQLVESHIVKRNASIQLDLGHYPYHEYEPMAYWGDNRKLKKILASTEAITKDA